MAQSEYPTARPFLPDDQSHESLARAAQGCKGCPLYKDATQAVFGAGHPDAFVMLVGQQPGTREDRIGEPFLGPAGKVLDQALHQVGFLREELYLTNAVKHAKFERQDGKKEVVVPEDAEITACRPWLEAEVALVQPKVVVALGVVAARSLTDHLLSIDEARRERHQTLWGQHLIVTYHPWAVLFAESDAVKDRVYDGLVEDLQRAHDEISGIKAEERPQL